MGDLPVIASVEGAVSDAEECFRLGVVGVLAIALEKGQGRNEVTLLQEMARIWQSQLLLLLVRRRGSVMRARKGGKLTARA